MSGSLRRYVGREGVIRQSLGRAVTSAGLGLRVFLDAPQVTPLESTDLGRRGATCT